MSERPPETGAPTGSRTLGNRYEIGDVLGYGGMAEVHRGRDVRLGREIAVKTLRADLARDPSFQARFRREAQSAASLNHPNVVAVYDTGDDDAAGTPYIVMEYVDGRTLRDVLHTEGRLLPHRALEITAEVLRALDYSHRNGIIHRDIKPGNVMLTRSGDVKVMDFGIARAVAGATSTMTQTAAIVGTAQYLSPEQARGEHVDQRSDIYSTGCLLYELLTGAPPFTGDSPVAVAYQHVREDPLPPSQVDPEVPPALDAIVLKAMAKNPANRYQSAAEMRADIERALAGRLVEATPVLGDQTAVYSTYAGAGATTVLQRVSEPDRRRRRIVAYVLLGVAVVGVFLLAALLTKALVGNKGAATISTPSLIGLTQQQAAQTLLSVGLQLGNVTSTFSDKPKGTVIDQGPREGINLHKGDKVDIVLSDGPQMVQVPDLLGKSQDDATGLLNDAKLKVGQVTTRDDRAPAGTVLETSPAAGATVAAGSKVDLVVASGKATVPDVQGQDQGSATAALQQAGFKVVVQQTIDDTVAPGTVLRQSPAGNTSAPRGSTVTIVVAQASPTPTPTPSTQPSATPSPPPSATPTP